MSAAPSNPLLPLLPQLNAAAQDISAQLQQAQSDLAAAKQQLASAQAAAAQQPQIAVGPTYVQPGDLGAILAKVGQPNTTLQLGAGTFTGGAITVNPALAGLRLLGIPGKTTLNLTAQPGTAGTGILFESANCEVGYVNVIGTAKCFLVYAPNFYLHDFTADQCQWLVHLEGGVAGYGGANNSVVARGKVGTTSDKGIYITADNVRVEDYTHALSIGEHCIRVDTSNSGHRPQNVTVVGANLANPDAAKKETLAVRECNGFRLLQSTSAQWVDIGQGNADQNVHVSGVIVDGLTITQLRPDGSLIQIRHDVDCVLANITAPGDTVDPLFSADARATVWLRGQPNWTNTPAPGQQWKVNGGPGKVVSL